MCQIGWRNGVNIEVFKKEVSLHLQEVRRWREIENTYHNDAVQYKSQILVLSYDDTSALQLPRFGNREPKGLGGGVWTLYHGILQIMDNERTTTFTP